MLNQNTYVSASGVSGDPDLAPFFTLLNDRVVLDLGDRPLVLEGGVSLMFQTASVVLAQSLELAETAAIHAPLAPLELRVRQNISLLGSLDGGFQIDLISLQGTITSGETSRLILDSGVRGDGRILLKACTGDIELHGLAHILQSGGPASRIHISAGGKLIINGQAPFGHDATSGFELFAGVRILASENAPAGQILLESSDDLQVLGYGHFADPGDQFQSNRFIPIVGNDVPISLSLRTGDAAGVVVGTLSLPEGNGDLLGIFGNISDESLLPNLSGAGPMVTDTAFRADDIAQLGGGNNVNPVKDWDWALRFAEAGSPAGTLTQVEFSLSGPGLTVGHLTRALNQGWLFGVRVQSQGSAKMGFAGPEPFDPARHLATVAVRAPSGGGSLYAQSLSGDLIAYEQAFQNSNPQNRDGLLRLEAAEDLILATSGSVDARDPAKTVIDSRDPKGDRTAVAGNNQLSAHRGAIHIGAAVQVLATAGKGQDGVNLLSACATTPDAAATEPRAQTQLSCSAGPETLFPVVAPVWTSMPLTDSAEGETWTYTAQAQTEEGHFVSYALLEGPIGMTLDPLRGILTWTTGARDAGTYAVQLQASSACLSVEQSFILHIEDTLNVDPIITSNPVTQATACEPYVSLLSASDGDGDALSFALIAAPTGMTLDRDRLTWTPTPEQQGDHAISWQVLDGRGAPVGQDFVLTVAAPTNQAPVFSSQPVLETLAGNAYRYQAVAVDPEGLAVRYSLIEAPAEAILDTDSGQLVWTPASEGVFAFQLQAVADLCGRAVQSFSLTVLPSNLPPTITSTAPLTASVSVPYSYSVTALDPEGEALVYSLDQAPVGMTIQAGSGLIQWAPNQSQANLNPVTVRATDPHGLFDTQTFSVYVNGSPYYTSTPVTQVAVLNPYRYALSAADPNPDDALTYRLDQGPAGLHLDGQLLTWVPDQNQTGPFQVELAVLDPLGLIGFQSYTLNVTTPDNRPPRITSTPETVHLLIPAAGAGEVISLQNWTVLNYNYQDQGFAKWTISPDYTDAFQSVNAKPSMLLSDFDLADEQIQGEWRVETTSDDDYIGFVLGFQDPQHFYLFDWKQGTQSGALRGMALKKYHLEAGMVSLWPTIPPATHGTLLYRNSIGWKDNTTYRFVLDFHPGDISISVFEGETLLDSFTVYDDTYSTGRFGFYNYSQERVRYRGFTREVLADRAYVYAPTAVDPDGDRLSWYLLEGPDGLVMDPQTGALSWMTATAQIGSYRIRIRVVDEHGLYDDQDYTLIVENEAPVITSEPVTRTRVEGRYSYDVAAVDPTPGDTLSYSLASAPAGMTIDPANGKIEFLPSAAQLGDHAVAIAVTDQLGHTFRQEYTLTVYQPDNLPPVILSDLPSNLVAQRLFSFRMEAFDPDGDPLTFTTPVAPLGLTINSQTGLIAWQVDQSEGEVRLTVDVHDPQGLYDSQSVTFSIFQNAAPEITSTPITRVTSGSAYRYQAQAHDADGEPLTWSLIAAPPGMLLDPTGLLTWAPGETHLGHHLVAIQVADPNRLTDVQAFELTVGSFENAAPTITSNPVTSARLGVAYSYQASAVDPDGDALVWSLAAAPPSMTVDPASGLISWDPQPGTHSVTLNVSDGAGGTDSQSWQLEIVANQAPVIISQAPSEVLAEHLYSYQAQAHDPDGDAVIWQLDQGPTGMLLSSDGLVTWVPSAEQVGQHPFALSVRDGNGGVDQQQVTLTVSAFSNHAPIFDSETTVLGVRNRALSYRLLAHDPDGDALSFRLVEGPEDLTVTADGLLSWTPQQAGSWLVTVEAVDPHAAATTQVLSLQIQWSGNTPPSFSSSPETVALAGLPYSYDAEVEDPEGYPIFFQLSQGPAGMELDRSRGIVSWTPSLSQLGSHSISLIVRDAHDAETVQTWQISVQNPGDITAPQVFLNLSAASVGPGELVNFQVARQDSGGIASTILTVNDQPVTLDAAGRGSFSSLEPGLYDAVAVVTDLAGNQAEHGQSFNITAPGDSDRPELAIHSPVQGQRLSAPAEVVITVRDPHLTDWILEVGKSGSDCFSEVAHGTQEQIVQSAAVLDTTLLGNDLYDLRLTAFDANLRGSQVSISLFLEGELKVGHFSLGYRDLDLPLRGIPAQLNRIYDSSDKCPGDFGIGWNQAKPELRANIHTGRFWDLDEQYFCASPSGPKYPPYQSCGGVELPYYCIADTIDHYVSVTLPGGQSELFDLNMDAFGGEQPCLEIELPDAVTPYFSAREGTTSRLEALDS